MSWVLRNSEARLGDRLVLLVYADHANDDGTSAWPAVETVAKEAHLSTRQAKRCIANLLRDGELRDTEKRSKAGTRVYELPLYQAAQGGDKLSKSAGVEVTSTAFEGVTSTTESVDRMSPEPSLVQPSELQPSEELTRAARASVSFDPPAPTKVDGQDLPWNALAVAAQAGSKIDGSRMRRALDSIRADVWEMAIERAGPRLVEVVGQFPAEYEKAVADMITSVAEALRDDGPTLTWGPEGIARNFRRGMALVEERVDVDAIVAATRAGRAA
jgi:hypothetical protein